MKRIVTMGLLFGFIGLVAAFGLVSAVNAQNPNPAPFVPGQGYGRGGMMGSGAGIMSPYMEAALAEKLELTVDELQALNDQGKTFWQIAADKGYTTEQAQQMMLDARNAALDQMIKDGKVTQEQADWMKDRSGQMGQRMGQGGCAGFDTDTGTPRGGRMGGRWNQ